MKEARQIKVVSPISLASYEGINGYRRLTIEEERKLGRQIATGKNPEARDTLVCCNLSLVIWVVSKYAKHSRFLEMPDLIQEGNLGLIRAAEKFNPTLGCKFSTYAVFWIRQHVMRALDNQSLAIRIPVHVLERHKKILVAAKKIAGNSETIPSAKAIARYLKVPLKSVHDDLRRMNLSAPVSLDGPVNSPGDIGTLTLQDFIADKNSANPPIIIEARQELEATYILLENILRAIKKMPGKNQNRNVAIFREFYGFDAEGKKKSLAKVGRKFNVSREYIRQILQKIFQTLSGQGIEVSLEVLGKYRWRIQELENLTASSRELNI